MAIFGPGSGVRGLAAPENPTIARRNVCYGMLPAPRIENQLPLDPVERGW